MTALNESQRDRLSRLLLAARVAKDAAITSPIGESTNVSTIPSGTTLNNLVNNSSLSTLDRYGNAIQYNEQQLKFVSLASSGKSCILIGAAGTGKTTCMNGTMQAIIESGHAGLLDGSGHKHLPESGAPGIVIISFTRRAVANIRKNLPKDLQANCLTYHALLQYEPVRHTVTDPNTLEDRTTMTFEPVYSADNPLPSSIRVCVIEEASMFSLEFYTLLSGALGKHVQYIFLGDIQQLPPVFGAAILGYKMLELPVVELTQVYRQALESPIIRLAHRILSGSPIPVSEYSDWKTPDKLTLHPWKKKLSADDALFTLAKFLKVAYDQGAYDPMEDMILIPFNKSCGTLELNKHIAQHLARKREAIVWEVIAGFNKLYFSVGDKVLVDKEDGIIIKIEKNPSYTGAPAQHESTTLDYWGFESGGKDTEHHIVEEANDDIDFLLSQSVALGGEDSEDRVRQASHTVTVRMTDTGFEKELNTASELNNLLHAFALTVHKSQGSEFKKVFLLLHSSHATMLQRELLYTAVTRAREELYVICEPETFTKGILSQKIKGNTLEEKAEFFKGKVDAKAKGRLL